jgi:Flp pilus assembly protein TadG
MRWMSPISGLRHDATRERGAVAVIVAICGVVIFGMAAYVIDTSSVYVERRELQNGADAAALAVARDCALGDCGDDYGTAQQYASGNAGDSAAGIREITYPAANRVRVQTETLDARADIDGDSSTVDFTFARLWGRTGRSVSATATAEWFAPAGATTLPITFSMCEWLRATDGGTTYSTPPPPWDADDTYHLIFFHVGNNQGANVVPDECAAQAGQDTDGDDRLQGGFGWLDSDGCSASWEVGDWVASQPGAAVPNGCDLSQLIGRELLIPIFDDVTESGGAGFNRQCAVGPGGKCYHLHGFAAFWITGYRFPGAHHPTRDAPCRGPDTCIGGYFIRFAQAWEGSGTGPDLGASVIRLVD